jgi:hypothetical protein
VWEGLEYCTPVIVNHWTVSNEGNALIFYQITMKIMFTWLTAAKQALKNDLSDKFEVMINKKIDANHARESYSTEIQKL